MFGPACTVSGLALLLKMLLYYSSWLSQSQLSAVQLRLRGFVMYTMNNHTYNAMRVLERYHRISYTLLIRTPLLFRQKMVIFVFYIRTRQNDSIVRTAKMQAR